MANQATTNALFKAAKGGDVAKIRQLLDAGVSIESTDMHRLTPVMLAAQAGQVEAFRLFVEKGANLHAVGMCDTDLLECAGEGGNVEIIRMLIEKGLPLEGHWVPKYAQARREGHINPLLSAALNGKVDAVRVLLEAGADRNAKFDGRTALQMAKDEVKFPTEPGDVDAKRRYQEIVSLLSGSSAGAAAPDDSAAREVGKFAANARGPRYSKLRDRLDELCGPHRGWKPVPDHGVPAEQVVRYTLKKCKQQQTIEELQQEARKAGCHLVLAEPWEPGQDAKLVLFPTDDKFAVIAAIGTEGANYSIRTEDVIEWLQKLDKQNPFHLVLCRHDFVGGEFRGAVKGAKKLAEEMAEFCSSCLDGEAETPEELAAMLKREKSFFLWWD
jgi:Domain of unknown function (DUF4253)